MLIEKDAGEGLDIEMLGLLSNQLAYRTTGRLSDLLLWISDEIYLCDEGVKDLRSSMPHIEGAIREITEAAA